MKNKNFNYQLIFRRASFVIYDVASVLAASFLAISMRYEFEYDLIPGYFLETIVRFLPFNIVFTIIIFYIFRLYHSLWAFAGESELQNVIVACFLSSAAFLMYSGTSKMAATSGATSKMGSFNIYARSSSSVLIL